MDRHDLTVCCFLWGTWGDDKADVYVRNLHESIQQHLSLPHRFVLFTDRKRKKKFSRDIEVQPMSVPDWKWNLRKMLLYKNGNGLRGRVLCFDLDVAITGSLDELASYDGPFATCEAAYRPGKIGGSLIGFEAGTLEEELWSPLWDNAARFEAATEGSERKYFEIQFQEYDITPDFWQDVYPGQVVSYKVDCQSQGAVPDNARVVRFHGEPRPHEVSDQWLKDYWRIDR